MLILTTLKRKVPFKIFQKFLKENGYKSSIGYDATIKKLYTQLDGDDLKKVDLEEKISVLVRDYLMFGQKVVYSYKFNKTIVQALLQNIHSDPLVMEKKGVVENLSIWMGPTENNIPRKSSQLKAAFDIGNLTCIIFSAKHTINQRVQLSLDALNESQFKEQYSDLYAVKHIEYQSFDSVIVDPEHSTVDFCIDNFYDLTQKNHYDLLIELRAKFRTQFGLEDDFFQTAENFFPLVNKYYSATHGVIKELEFKTEDGSIKTAKMRTDSDDLRADRFHKGGAKAVDQRITPYSIDIVLHNETSGNKAIRKRIPGKHQALNYANPKIEFYEFYSVLNASDYSFLKEMMYRRNNN